MSEKSVKRFQHVDIGIEIDSALGDESVESCYIRDEGIFARIICLADIGIEIKVEIALVPLFYLIIGTMSVPGFDVPERVIGQRTVTEPAVMYFLGDRHGKGT